MKTALFSAFPQELSSIIKKLKAEKIRRSPFKTWAARTPAQEVIMVLSGMGVSNSEAAWNYAVQTYHPDQIISAGFGGALYESATIGDVIAGSNVIPYPGIGEAQNNLINIPALKNFILKMGSGVSVREGSILTFSERVDKASVDKKLLRAFSFPVCDMETFPLAKLSFEAGLPFFAIRAITDLADEEIPSELFGVTDANGNFSLFRALAIIFGRPSLMPVFIRMGKNSRTASKNLSTVIEALLRVL